MFSIKQNRREGGELERMRWECYTWSPAQQQLCCCIISLFKIHLIYGWTLININNEIKAQLWTFVFPFSFSGWQLSLMECTRAAVASAENRWQRSALTSWVKASARSVNVLTLSSDPNVHYSITLVKGAEGIPAASIKSQIAWLVYFVLFLSFL